MGSQTGAAEEVRALLAEVLGIGDRARTLDAATPLIGSLPELDSMAVAEIIVALEERLGVDVDEAEIDAEVLETFGSLVTFVEENRTDR
jgi:acyl carrier protein